MVKIYKLIALMAIVASSVFSCVEPDLNEGRTNQVNGLMNVIIRIPGSPTEYPAEKPGPYADGEEIIVKVPTTDEDPTDISRLIMTASLEHNCYIQNPLGKIQDLTEPYPLDVTDVNGIVHHNTVKVILVPPRVRVKEMWTKSCMDLGVSTRNITGVALNGTYMAVQQWGYPEENAKFYLFDMLSGSKIKAINNPWTFIMKCESDDAGHFLSCRENIYGAGFIVYLYDEENDIFHQLLNFTASDGCPNELGYSFSVIGDVTTGKAYIYAMPKDAMTVYYWEMMDGVLLDPESEPKTLRYGPAKSNWILGTVQRESLDKNADHFISFFRHDKDLFVPDPAKEQEAVEAGYGSHFHIFDKDMNVKMMDPRSHYYKILDFKVFTLGEHRYLVTNEQAYLDWGECRVRLYDITNPDMLSMTPMDNGFNQFRIWESDFTVPTNYNIWGDIDIHQVKTETGFDVYIAAATVGLDTKQSNIRMFKMTYLKQE